jgi:hypothetical protein
VDVDLHGRTNTYEQRDCMTSAPAKRCEDL